jgi:DNA-binding transcriptional MerR regulator
MPRRTIRTDQAKKGRDEAVPESLAASSLSLGTPTLTVGQIAEQLSPIAPDRAGTRERIRHWTREGLISPVASHHSGTGKHRKYDESSKYDAAILHVVASAGLHIVTQPYLLDTLSRARVARRKWALTNRGPLLLEISHKAAGAGTVIAVHEGAAKCDPTAELSIVINLAQIFEAVRRRDT